MASLLTQTKFLIIFALAGFVQLAIATGTPNFAPLCYKYYGSIEAEVEFVDQDIEAKNYNNTIRCPYNWLFRDIEGALLEVCTPPSNLSLDKDDSDIQYTYNPDGAAVTVSLTFEGREGGSTNFNEPIGGLNLSNILVTNTSYASKSQSDRGKSPAILARDGDILRPVAIKGTGSAFMGGELGPEGSVTLSCTPVRQEDRSVITGDYCGSQKDADEGGCWGGQTFFWNGTDPVNYTISLGSDSASVDIWTEAPYKYKRKGERFRTAVHLYFFGDHRVPDESKDEFWDNTDLNYKEEMEDADPDFTLRRDDVTGLPLFLNESEDAWLLWYSIENGSFQINPEKGGSGRVERLSLLFGVCFAGVIFMVI